MRKFITFIVLLSVFLDSVIFVRKPINLFLYYVFYLLFIGFYVITYKNIKINKNFIGLFLLVAITSILTALLGGSNILLVFKQLFVISFSALTFYLFIDYANYDIQTIFRSYVRLAFWIAVIGLFQEFSFLIDFEYGYDYSSWLSYWRLYVTEFKYYLKVNSIVSEPSHFAIALSPALFASLDSFFHKNSFVSRNKACVIIVAFLLSGSALGMTSFIIAILMIMYKHYAENIKKALQGKLLLYLFPFFIFLTIAGKLVYELPFIKLRVDDSVKLVSSNNPQVLARDLNLSTFAIYSNFLVAKESFVRNPLFGSGLGTHSDNYEKYIGKFFDTSLYGVKNAINKEDGSTLLIRLISEMGIFGLIILSLFLTRNYVSNFPLKEDDYDLWLINHSALLLFILKILRHGNYSLLGFFLFAFLYFFSHKQMKAKKLSAQSTKVGDGLSSV